MSEAWYRLTIGLGRVFLRLLGLRVRWQGEEHLPATGPVVLACVHVSFLDFLLVERAALARDRFVRFLCRHDVWKAPLVGRVMDGMRHVPVDRQAPAAAYLRARHLLEQGQAVCVFPEAGISHSFTVRALMRGAAALASETGAPLVPVVVWGGQRVLTVGRGDRLPRPDLRRGRTVDVRFGAPALVPFDADLVAATQALGHTLTGMLEEVQRLPAHRPSDSEHAPWYPAHLGGHAPDRAAALALDDVPRSAVWPTWGPTPDRLR